MNKGFTLLEIMVVVAIIAILSAGGVMAIGDRIEKNAIITAKSELPIYIRNVIDRSFSEGIKQTIIINENGELTLERTKINSSNNEVKITEKFEFPKNLKYVLTPTSLSNTIIVGEKGEFNENFTLTVKTKRDETIMTIRGTNMGGTATNKEGIFLGKITIQ